MWIACFVVCRQIKGITLRSLTNGGNLVEKCSPLLTRTASHCGPITQHWLPKIQALLRHTALDPQFRKLFCSFSWNAWSGCLYIFSSWIWLFSGRLPQLFFCWSTSLLLRLLLYGVAETVTNVFRYLKVNFNQGISSCTQTLDSCRSTI